MKLIILFQDRRDDEQRAKRAGWIFPSQINRLVGSFVFGQLDRGTELDLVENIRQGRIVDRCATGVDQRLEAHQLGPRQRADEQAVAELVKLVQQIFGMTLSGAFKELDGAAAVMSRRAAAKFNRPSTVGHKKPRAARRTSEPSPGSRRRCGG